MTYKWFLIVGQLEKEKVYVIIKANSMRNAEVRVNGINHLGVCLTKYRIWECNTKQTAENLVTRLKLPEKAKRLPYLERGMIFTPLGLIEGAPW